MLCGATDSSKQTCSEQCNSAFGAEAGKSFLTVAYSNCSGHCVSHENNYITLKNTNKRLFTGMKWQCVEYSRRWLIENRGLTFADVEYAYHIWDLKFVETVDTHQHKALARHKNKISKAAPAVGDLLIYSNKLALTGHVAVIVGIDNDSILIAEQNYFNRPWESKDYARRLLLDKDSEGRYRIFDDSVIGWLHISK